MNLWHPVTNALLSTLFAPPCATCATTLDTPLEGAVCRSCWAILERLPPHTFSIAPSIRMATALGEYDGLLRDAIHALKYDGRRTVGPGLSRIMAIRGYDVLEGADLVVPVPLHRARQRERGFNQSDALATGLNRTICRALRRTRSTRPQVDLTAHERYQNVAEAFSTSREANQTSGRIVVLVDDVTTTGATLDACAGVLLAAGAREVRALTAARVSTAPR